MYGVCRVEKEKITCDFSPAFTLSICLCLRKFWSTVSVPLELPFLSMKAASRPLYADVLSVRSVTLSFAMNRSRKFSAVKRMAGSPAAFKRTHDSCFPRIPAADL